MEPIKFEDLELTEDEMEKIAAGARIFLAPEEVPDLEEPPELEEAPSDLVTVTRRNP